MKIAGLQKVTLIDFPDRIAASVFLAGCNLNCGYCHNRWMIDADGVEPELKIAQFFDWLDRRVGLLDGICVSGGEPTIHRQLPSFLHTIKELGFEVKLDTNGTLPDRLEGLLAERLLDYVAMDIKAPLDDRYSLIAGRSVDLEAIRKSMALLRDADVGYEFRTTVEPRLDRSALQEIAREMQPNELWYLQPFEPSPGIALNLVGLTWPDQEELNQWAEVVEPRTANTRVRGESS